jgi:exo-1,4-beta-D-glucosaminidase
MGGLLAVGVLGCGAESAESLGTVQDELISVYQAENAADIDEGVVESSHAGYTGSGYVNIANATSSFMWHVVDAPAAGRASLRVRYANGTGSNRPIALTVNGVSSGTVNGAPTGAWSTWVTSGPISINLLAGSNDIVHSSVTADGMPNIDRFEIAQTFTRTYQAEAAFDIDEGVIESIHTGYTGTGYVNVNNFSNTFIWFVVNSPVTATATLRVRYANGGGTNRPIAVSPGSSTLTGAPTGAWTNWVTSSAVTVSLSAGNNDVILSSVSSDGMPNIDRFDITW